MAVTHRGAAGLPNVEQLEAELDRVEYWGRYRTVMRSTVFVLVAVAAAAVLVATLFLPVLQIYGSSMSPSLKEGQIVVAVKGFSYEPGDVVAFYYNNRVLVKRVIASAGDWVDIDANGTVYVNGFVLDEPYVTEPALGAVDIDLPYQVPEDRVFVMGDHRSTSVDSRHSSVGCIAEEQMVGTIVFCVWPLSSFGGIQ